MDKLNSCIDCGKEISPRAKRCRSCNSSLLKKEYFKTHSSPMKGKKHLIKTKEKISLTKRKYYETHDHPMKGKGKHFHCIDCGKEIYRTAKRCNRCNQKGRKRSETSKERMSLAQIEYLKTHPNSFKGKKHTEESKKQMKISRKKFLEVNPHPMKGKKVSEKQRKQIEKHWRKYFKTHDGPMKGKNHSLKTKQKVSSTKQGIDIKDWTNFKSLEPYDDRFNKLFKKEIRKRDNQECMLCGKSRKEMDRALSVHHIDYNKLYSIPKNCISLCDACHGFTNDNRKYWKQFFQSILCEKYMYEYHDEEVLSDIKEEKVNKNKMEGIFIK